MSAEAKAPRVAWLAAALKDRFGSDRRGRWFSL